MNFLLTFEVVFLLSELEAFITSSLIMDAESKLVEELSSILTLFA